MNDMSQAAVGYRRELETISVMFNYQHYDDVIMGMLASQITSLTIVYSTFYSDADQRKHQSSASLAFVRGIHRGPVNSPHKWPVTRKMFPFDDVIINTKSLYTWPSTNGTGMVWQRKQAMTADSEKSSLLN